LETLAELDDFKIQATIMGLALYESNFLRTRYDVLSYIQDNR